MADPHSEADTGAYTEESPTAAVYAAMMEELGLARKDTLPLEDKKGLSARVDLDALDRAKKAYDPRTTEYKIAKENETARLAWKNAEFGDVDPKDLNLDQMDSGQSHRLRMRRTLEASQHSRGGHATRGARGAQIARGGGSHSLSRLSRSNRRSDAKSDKNNVDRALARLGARSVSNVMARSGIRGAGRSSNSKLTNRLSDNSAPKGLFSFHDNKKGIHSEPETKEALAAGKVLKPNNYNQGFGLASAEDFLSQAWAGTSSSTDMWIVKDDNLIHSDLLFAARNTQKVVTKKSKIENRSVQELVEPSITLIDFQQKIVKPAPGDPTNTIHDVSHSSLVRIGNYLGGKVIMIGLGHVYIKTVGSSLPVAKVLTIEHEGKTCLEEPLHESIDFQLETRTISFHAGHEGRKIKWILMAPTQEAATNLLASLEQHKSASTHVSSCDSSSKANTGNTATLVETSNLISYQEEDHVSTPIVSKFREDLLSLMGDPPVEDIVVNTPVNQDAESSTEAHTAVNPIVGEIPKHQSAFRGLATSRYAEKSELFGLANRTTLSQKSRDSFDAIPKKNLGKRVSKKTQDITCDKTALDAIKQGQSRSYTIEELKRLRPSKNSAKTSFLPLEDLKFPSEGEPQPFFCFTDQETPSISAREVIQQPSGLKSKHTSPHTERVLEENTESGYAATPVSKVAQELSHPKSPDQRIPDLIPGPSTEKTDGHSVEQLVQEPLEIIKSGLFPTGSIHDFPKSTPNTYHTVNASQSSAKLIDEKDLDPRSMVGLLISTTRSNPSENKGQFLKIPISPEHQLTESLKELSMSDLDGPVGVEKTTKYPKLRFTEQSANKPYQGLSNSRYATLSQAERKIPVTSTTSRVKLKNPGSIKTISLLTVTAPDVIDEMASRANPKNENSDKCESSTSHISKCSEQTIKLCMQVSSFEPGVTQKLSLQTSPAALNHQSLPKTDSLSSSTSVTNMVKDLVNIGATKSTYLQPETSDVVLSPNSGVEMRMGVTQFSVKSGHSTDVSGLIQNTQSAAPQPLPSNTQPATSALAKSSANPPQKRFESSKVGLLSSRYATAQEEIASDEGTGETRPHLPKTIPSVKYSSNTQKLILSLPDSGPGLSHRPRGLQPTASQFTPSTARASPVQTHNLPPPVMNPLSQPMQPPMATVLVPDPQRPGYLTEVCGYLKMSSTPIVGFFVNENSPIGEGLASAASQASMVSPVATVDPAEKIASSLIAQDSKSVTEKRQEIQERLLRSLEKRRLSRSPGYSGR